MGPSDARWLLSNFTFLYIITSQSSYITISFVLGPPLGRKKPPVFGRERKERVTKKMYAWRICVQIDG